MVPNIGYYFYYCRRHTKYQFFQEVYPTKSDKLVHNKAISNSRKRWSKAQVFYIQYAQFSLNWRYKCINTTFQKHIIYINSLSITELISGVKIIVQNKTYLVVQAYKIDYKSKCSILS
jgi:hypothetical protein